MNGAKPKILITDGLNAKGLAILAQGGLEPIEKKGPKEDELCAMIGEYEGLIVRSATKVTPGTPVTVTANVANTGTGNGASVIKVYVNGAEEARQGVTVNSGGTSQVSFDISRSDPGTYTVYVGGTQAGSFTVDQFTPDTILYISGALVFFALVGGIIWITRRRA